ncbi:MAG: hypothetical protein ACK4SY_08750 [Pyrobaculum sp.]
MPHGQTDRVTKRCNAMEKLLQNAVVLTDFCRLMGLNYNEVFYAARMCRLLDHFVNANNVYIRRDLYDRLVAEVGYVLKEGGIKYYHFGKFRKVFTRLFHMELPPKPHITRVIYYVVKKHYTNGDEYILGPIEVPRITPRVILKLASVTQADREKRKRVKSGSKKRKGEKTKMGGGWKLHNSVLHNLPVFFIETKLPYDALNDLQGTFVKYAGTYINARALEQLRRELCAIYDGDLYTSLAKTFNMTRGEVMLTLRRAPHLWGVLRALERELSCSQGVAELKILPKYFRRDGYLRMAVDTSPT